MEGLKECFAGIGKLINHQLDCSPNNSENSFKQTICCLQLETNINPTLEKFNFYTNLQLILPEHIANGCFDEFLCQHFAKTTTLSQTLNELKLTLLQLNGLNSFVASYAPGADLDEHHPYNGYRSMMKINMITVKDMQSILQTDNKKPSHSKLQFYLYRLKLIVLVNLIQISWRAESDRLGHNPQEPNLFHSKSAIFWLDMFTPVVPYSGSYYVDHLGFFLNPELRKFNLFMVKAVASVHSLPNSLILPFWKKKLYRTASKALGNPNMRWPLGGLASLDDRFFRVFIMNLYHRKTPSKSTTYFLPKQQQWILRSLEDVLKDPEQPGFVYKDTGGSDNFAWDHQKVIKSNKFGMKPNTVRIRVIQNSKSKPDGTVLFHCHGGSFVMHSPDCHEIYLRDWICDNPKLTIVSVDYQLGKVYPVALQDVLDVFLWLTSGSDQVQQVLGFQPSKIVAAGDSAGAFLVYTLSLILTDMKEYADKRQLCAPPRLPKALVLVYGCYTFKNPSIFMSNAFLDFFLPPSVIRIAFGSLIKGCDHYSWNAQMFCHCLLDCLPIAERPWYDMRNDSRNVSEEVLYKCSKIFYLKTLTDYDFNKIDIPLYIISSTYDVCIDHSIELARKYKGKRSLHILEDLPHGYLQLNFANDCANKGSLFVSQKIKEAFID